MSEHSSTPEPAKPEPLFEIDLGSNGGRVAPTSVSELQLWIQRERQFWSWVTTKSRGGHEQSVREAIQRLEHATSSANDAERQQSTNQAQSRVHAQSAANLIQEVFNLRKLPHSSSTNAKRVEQFLKEHGDTAASYFLSVILPPPQGYSIQPQEIEGYFGLFEGIVERFELFQRPSDKKIRASAAAIEELRLRIERELSEKGKALESLHRSFESITREVRELTDSQKKSFSSANEKREKEFEGQSLAHVSQMDLLRKTFKEEMALRAPAEYWTSKRNGHWVLAAITGVVTFLGIGLCSWFLALEVKELIGRTPLGSSPETWRIVLLVLLSVFSVWAIRLVVRIFLSQIHLATDAGERIVMVKTYLALLEGDKLATKEDRQLILQALFRTAADGIVKDEGVPPSFLELLTRK